MCLLSKQPIYNTELELIKYIVPSKYLKRSYIVSYENKTKVKAYISDIQRALHASVTINEGHIVQFMGYHTKHEVDLREPEAMHRIWCLIAPYYTCCRDCETLRFIE